jgi:myosin heavy subunit
MRDLAFSPEEQTAVYAIVAAILHIGNVAFTVVNADECNASAPADKAALERAAALLQVPPLPAFARGWRANAMAGDDCRCP